MAKMIKGLKTGDTWGGWRLDPKGLQELRREKQGLEQGAGARPRVGRPRARLVSRAGPTSIPHAPTPPTYPSLWPWLSLSQRLADHVSLDKSASQVSGTSSGPCGGQGTWVFW